MAVREVPTTLVTGFLGVGKTTAIRDLLKQSPAGETWAVLVNEFGEVGIDGAVLGSGELAVREVAGGCICCSAGMALQVALVRLLREVAPDRLIIEPTGLAHPASVLDLMRRPGLREALARRATITLVDPVKFTQPRYAEHDTYRDQVTLADVLVANRCDLASDEEVGAFQEAAGQLYPPKLIVETTSFGRLDPAWLELDPVPRTIFRRAEHRSEDYVSRGWVFPWDDVFDRRQLEAALQELARPSEGLPAGVVRLKGVFRTPGVVLLVNGDAETLRFEALNYRRDSRFEVIVPAEPAPRWDLVEARILESRRIVSSAS